MPEIFISYARSTGAQAHRIEEALRALGYDVWRDDELPAHRAYAEVIEERLRLADAVLVLWSADAARSQWVRSEANRAREDGKLVQLTLDNTRLPLPFDQIHCADFSSWSGEPDAHEWRLVLSSIEQLTDGKSQDAPSAAEAPAHLPSHVHGAGPPEPGLGPPLPLPAKPSIAVLPFKDLSSVRRQEYLADALTEDTTTALSRWRWFFVISSHTSLRYKDREVDVRSIGNELGVRYALEGSVRKAGKRLRVSVQLSETASGSNVWAEQFDRDVADILALQDEITEQIVTAIEPAMLRSEGINIARKSVTDFSALDFFYRGMWHLNRMSEESDRKAESLFRSAIRRDPELSLGHIGLARALFGRAIYGASSKPVPLLVKARASAQTAIGLDPRDASGYYASAGASLYLGDHGAALDEARSAIALNPNFAFAQVRLGQVLIFIGQPSEAIAPIERGVRLSPYDPQLGVNLELLALAHYQARDYEGAVRHARSAMHQNNARTSAILAAGLAQLGRLDEAAKVVPQRPWAAASTQQPLAAPYADPAMLEHLRDGVRRARYGVSSLGLD